MSNYWAMLFRDRTAPGYARSDMGPVKTRKAEQAEATRAALLSTARALFTERGFADTPTEEIVRRAGVTRGALYHHFQSKEDLFRALVEEVETEITHKIAETFMRQPDTWDGIVVGCEMFLDACLDPGVQRILIVDAPAVLGPEVQREIEEKYGLAITRHALQRAIDEGLVDPQPPDILARIVLGALREGALHIARAADPVAVRNDVGVVVRRLLEGLRTSGARKGRSRRR